MVSDKSESLLMTNIKFNYVLIKWLQEDQKTNASLFSQQMANINYLLQFDQQKCSFFQSRFGLLQQLVCQVSTVMSTSLSQVAVDQALLTNYAEVLHQLIESHRLHKANRSAFPLIVQLTDNISQCAALSPVPFHKAFSFQAVDTVYAFISLFNYAMEMYSSIEDSTDISKIDKIFCLMDRIVDLMASEKVTAHEQITTYNDIQGFVHTLIKNSLDEQNQYIQEKVQAVLRSMVAKQKFFFEKEYVTSVKKQQFGRITLLKRLLQIK